MSISENNDLSFAGRVRGLVHGVAFGDAMGAPIEKLSADEIRARYGFVDSLATAWHRDGQGQDMRKGRVRGNGIVTDDTLMTLALMNVYNDVARHIDAWDMADGMVRQIAWTPRWIPELQRDAALIERLFYPEKWIFQRHQLSACDPRQGGIGNMVNCGAAMYIAPIGAINACNPRAAYDEAIAFASGHQQSFGLEAAGVLAGAVAAAFVPGTDIGAVVAVAHDLARDGTRDAIGAIAEVAEQLRASGAEHQQVVTVFHDTIRRFSPMGDDVSHTAEKVGRASPGYQPSRQHSIEELPLALGFALLAAGDFRRAVVDGVNSGRDTDSIGVMAGAILGAMHGAAVLDPDDAALLDRANRLDLNAEAARFARTGIDIMRADRDRTATVLTNRAHLTP
jgi:ADP-ribosylglycohydrolase